MYAAEMSIDQHTAPGANSMAADAIPRILDGHRAVYSFTPLRSKTSRRNGAVFLGTTLSADTHCGFCVPGGHQLRTPVTRYSATMPSMNSSLPSSSHDGRFGRSKAVMS
eukprot:1264095-Rhodomonas_salina.1